MAYGPGSSLLKLAGTGIELQKLSHAPVGQEAQAENAAGDILASKIFGAWEQVTEEYKVRTGTAVTAPDLGSVPATSSYRIVKFTATRSNKETLLISATGILSSLFAAAPGQYAINALFPAGYLTGGKGALAAGVTVTDGAVISGSIDCSITPTDPMLTAAGVVDDIAGARAGRLDATNECQGSSAVPTASAAASWQLAAGSGATSADNQSYGTATFSAFRNVAAT